MPAPLNDIQKGPILAKIDALSADPVKRDEFLQKLQDPQLAYVDILLSYDVVTLEEAGHLRRHWFPTDPKDPNA